MSKLEIVINLMISCFLLILGFLSIFFPKKVIEVSINLTRSKDGNIKFRHIQKMMQKKWLPTNIRICGFGMLFMAVIIIWISLENIKK